MGLGFDLANMITKSIMPNSTGLDRPPDWIASRNASFLHSEGQPVLPRAPHISETIAHTILVCLCWVLDCCKISSFRFAEYRQYSERESPGFGPKGVSPGGPLITAGPVFRFMVMACLDCVARGSSCIRSRDRPLLSPRSGRPTRSQRSSAHRLAPVRYRS